MNLILILVLILNIYFIYNYINFKRLFLNCLKLFCKYTHYKILLFISYILSYILLYFFNKKKYLDTINHVLYKNNDNKNKYYLKKSIANIIFNFMMFFKSTKYLLSKVDLPEKIKGNNYILGCHIGFYFGYYILDNFLVNDFILCKKIDDKLDYRNTNKLEFLFLDNFHFYDLHKNMKTKSLVILADTYRKSNYNIQIEKLNTTIISFFPLLFKKNKKDVYFYIIYFDFLCEKFIKLKVHKIGNKNSNIKDILQEYGRLWLYYCRKYPEQNFWTLGNFLFKSK